MYNQYPNSQKNGRDIPKTGYLERFPTFEEPRVNNEIFKNQGYQEIEGTRRVNDAFIMPNVETHPEMMNLTISKPRQSVVINGGFGNERSLRRPFDRRYVTEGVTEKVIGTNSIRLSFISEEDQYKFQALFLSLLKGNEKTIRGESARNLLLKSGLSSNVLANVWSLCDIEKRGSLYFPEFALTLHLCRACKRGDKLPFSLPQSLYNEIKYYVSQLNSFSDYDQQKNILNEGYKGGTFNITDEDGWMIPNNYIMTEGKNSGLQLQSTGLDSDMYHPQRAQSCYHYPNSYKSNLMMNSSANFVNIGPNGLFLAPQNTGNYSLASVNANNNVDTSLLRMNLNSKPKMNLPENHIMHTQNAFQGHSNTSFNDLNVFNTSYPNASSEMKNKMYSDSSVFDFMLRFFSPTSTYKNNQHVLMNNSLSWSISKEEINVYNAIFHAWDFGKKGYIDGETSEKIFSKSNLDRSELESIWNLSDANDSGVLNISQFAIAMHLVYRRLNGCGIPLRLPPELLHSINYYFSKKSDKTNSDYKSHSMFLNPDDSNKSLKNIYTNSNINNFSNLDFNDEKNRSNSDDALIKTLNDELKKNKLMLKGYLKSSLSFEQEIFKYNQDIIALKIEIHDVEKNFFNLASNNVMFLQYNNLHNKFNHITNIELPQLFSELNELNKKIIQRKVYLFNLKLSKENVSWKSKFDEFDLFGTGENGEFTDADLHKINSKKLLNEKLSALTGDSSQFGFNKILDQKLEAEIQKSRLDNETQLKSLNDLKMSIKYLEKSCFSNFKSFKILLFDDTYNKKKSEYSVEVLNFVSDLEKSFSLINFDYNPKINDILNNNPVKNNLNTSVDSNLNFQSSLNSEANKTSYIKLQAEKKMNERLSKLKLFKKNYNSEEFISEENKVSNDISVKSDHDLDQKINELKIDDQYTFTKNKQIFDKKNDSDFVITSKSLIVQKNEISELNDNEKIKSDSTDFVTKFDFKKNKFTEFNKLDETKVVDESFDQSSKNDKFELKNVVQLKNENVIINETASDITKLNKNNVHSRNSDSSLTDSTLNNSVRNTSTMLIQSNKLSNNNDKVDSELKLDYKFSNSSLEITQNDITNKNFNQHDLKDNSHESQNEVDQKCTENVDVLNNQKDMVLECSIKKNYEPKNFVKKENKVTIKSIEKNDINKSINLEISKHKTSICLSVSSEEWGSNDEYTSEIDDNKTGAAHLANLLFSGMNKQKDESLNQKQDELVLNNLSLPENLNSNHSPLKENSDNLNFKDNENQIDYNYNNVSRKDLLKSLSSSSGQKFYDLESKSFDLSDSAFDGSSNVLIYDSETKNIVLSKSSQVSFKSEELDADEKQENLKDSTIPSPPPLFNSNIFSQINQKLKCDKKNVSAQLQTQSLTLSTLNKNNGNSKMDISALLSQIQNKQSLKKIDKSQQNICENTFVGKVL